MIGDAEVVANYLKLRMSERKVMPIHVQRASAFAWTNYDDVRQNRELYTQKVELLQRAFNAISRSIAIPEGSFYCWLDISDLHKDDQEFALRLAQETGVLTFPGSFFSVDGPQGNPGTGFLRIALIDTVETTEHALKALTQFISSYRS
jgi:N-succinyldiaminopimelate aminotransferase